MVKPSKVYDMRNTAAWIINQVEQKNAISIFRVEPDCQSLHIYARQIVNDWKGPAPASSLKRYELLQSC